MSTASNFKRQRFQEHCSCIYISCIYISCIFAANILENSVLHKSSSSANDSAMFNEILTEHIFKTKCPAKVNNLLNNNISMTIVNEIKK